MSEHTHCWHDTGIGGGSIGTDSDGTVRGTMHGFRVCCHCGAHQQYEHKTEHKPTPHGPHHPGWQKVRIG